MNGIPEVNCNIEKVMCQEDVNSRVGTCEYECVDSIGAYVRDLFDMGTAEECQKECRADFQKGGGECDSKYESCQGIVKEEQIKLPRPSTEIVLKASCLNKKVDCYNEGNSLLGDCKWECKEGIASSFKSFFTEGYEEKCMPKCETDHQKGAAECNAEYEKCAGTNEKNNDRK